MSSAWKDWKDDMECGVMKFTKDGKEYTGIKFDREEVCVDQMNYEFADFICDDIVCLSQLKGLRELLKIIQQFGEQQGEPAFAVNGKPASVDDLVKSGEVLIVNVGSSDYDYEQKQYYRDYEGTLYVFHNDWLMLDENNHLFVVNENEIKSYGEPSYKYGAEK